MNPVVSVFSFYSTCVAASVWGPLLGSEWVRNGDRNVGRASVERELRLLSVHAHPDDESSKGAATMAKYVDEGAQVLVVTCTGGERGGVLNPRLRDDPQVLRDLPGYRRQEMARAVEILGVRHAWLGFEDSGLPEGDPRPPLPPGCFALQPLGDAAAPLVRIMRSFRPHVVLTYDENGGYPHPDHIKCHEISVEAFEAAEDPSRYPDGQEPWRPSKLYYDRAFSPERVRTMHEAILAEGLQSPFDGWLLHRGDGARPVTTRIRCSDYFEVRERALLSHATQVSPDDKWFFALPRERLAKVWPTEEYELVRSRVPVELPEDDLFAGLRDRVGSCC
jgi:mycothiol S-conjugate amidase